MATLANLTLAVDAWQQFARLQQQAQGARDGLDTALGQMIGLRETIATGADAADMTEYDAAVALLQKQLAALRAA